MASILSKLRPNRQPNSLKKYTKPKIYHGGKNFDLSKRWYVYYSYLNPNTGEMVQQPPVYYKVNRHFKTKHERLRELKELRNDMEELLRKGFSPYEEESQARRYTCESALDFALSLKKNTLKSTSYRDYENRLSHFKTYLNKKGLLKSNIEEVNRKVVNAFLNEILNKSSARNRNNTRVVLSALFGILEDNDIIQRNFIRNIKNLKTSPTRNKTYSLERVDEIYEYLEENDTLLLLFIKFVSYNFLRPIEVCRLQVKDIDVNSKLIHVRAKNKAVKTKIIPDILMDDIKKMELTNPDHFIFTPNGVGEWETKEENRREYFTKRFKSLKDHFTKNFKEKGVLFELGKDYTIYSFRHTFITKLYRQLRESYNQSETYDKLMLITGHSTLKALRQYLRDIDAELPEDYSHYLY